MHKTYISSAISIIALLGVVYYTVSPTNKVKASITLMASDQSIVNNGKELYAQNCASCHGVNLEGQANWRQRDAEDYLPAPPHSKDGHTWHHTDSDLFLMTKYGIEKTIGEKYPNNMPAYEGLLSDYEIIAALSYIKSSWPKHIQRQHDQITSRANLE